MCCSSGSSTTVSQTDPQVGEAAKENAQTARDQLAFTKGYFNDTLKPLQEREQARLDAAAAREDEAYGINRAREARADERYTRYGIPAEDRYFDMVGRYSAPEEEERQARAAYGDVVNQAQTQQGDLTRRLQAAGIDPTSPAAIAARSDAALATAAAGAGAANRARDAARSLGIQLTGDAANYGRGMQSATSTWGQAASGNNAAGAAFGTQGSQSAGQAGSFVQNGYRNANAAFGQNLSSLVSEGNSKRAAAAQMESANSQGMGSGIGGIIGAAGSVAAAFV